MQFTGKAFYTFDGTINNIAEVYFRGFGAGVGDETLHIDNFWMACSSNTDWYDSNIDIWYASTSALNIDLDDMPFVELQAYNGTIALSDSSNNWLSDAISDSNVHKYNARSVTTSISALRVWLDGLSMCDYVRFYSMKDFSYQGSGNIDKYTYFYHDTTNSYLVGHIDCNDAGWEYLDIKQDLSDFSSSSYKYVRMKARVSDSNIKIQLRVYYTDATYLEIAVTDTSWNETTYDLNSGKTVDYILITIGDSSASVSSGDYYGYIDYITFSVAEINIDSISVNYEDTWLSPDQSISITSIVAKWSDGTTISEDNFRVDFWENSSIQQSNTSAPISRTVQLWNTTYQLGISWCNDSRYRFWVLGSNYTFWIVGSEISTGFFYDVQKLSDGNYIIYLEQTQQFRYSTNGSVMSNQPYVYAYVNTTSKGYKILQTDAWLPYERLSISLSSSEGSYDSYFGVKITIGDYEYVCYNLTINPSSETVSHLVFNFYSTYDGLGLEDDLLKIYVDGTRIYGMETYVSGNTINLTITDYFDRNVYSNAAYSFTSADIVFIDVGLNYYPITFINPGYDTLIVELTTNGVSKNITVPALGMSQPYRAISGTFSIQLYYTDINNDGETETYTYDIEIEDISITSESYVVTLPPHQKTADVPSYPRSNGSGTDYVFLLIITIIIIVVVVIMGAYAKTSGRGKELIPPVLPDKKIDYTIEDNVKKRLDEERHKSIEEANKRLKEYKEKYVKKKYYG